MHLTALYAAAGLALPHLAVATVVCKTGAHIIVSRGTTEQLSFGLIGPVVTKITATIPDSAAVAVQYPATFTNPFYTMSEQEGVGNLTQLIHEYGDSCPHGKMVLMGYSQGAQVTGDTLIGTDDDYFTTADELKQKPLATKYLDKIVAVILMGDPTHVPGESFNVGNSTHLGLLARQNSALFTSLGLAPKIQSYCDDNDKYCDNGTSSLVHVTYTERYTIAATNFVVAKFKAEKNKNAVNSNSNSNSSATGAAKWNASGTASATGAATTTGTAAKASGTAAAASPTRGEAAAVGKGAMGYLMTGMLGSVLVLALNM